MNRFMSMAARQDDVHGDVLTNGYERVLTASSHERHTGTLFVRSASPQRNVGVHKSGQDRPMLTISQVQKTERIPQVLELIGKDHPRTRTDTWGRAMVLSPQDLAARATPSAKAADRLAPGMIVSPRAADLS